MKTISILLLALVIGLIPNTLDAQSANSDTAYNEPVNYFAEFADLMHEEIEVKSAPSTKPHVNRFPAFVHYRTVMNGEPENFPAYYEKIALLTVPPPVKTRFDNWTVGQGCPYEVMTADCIAYTNMPIENCSGR